jgi:hypothetical protein
MKRNISRSRAISFSARPFKPRTTHDPLVLRSSSASEQSSIRAKRIFVISRVSLLPATNTQGKTIQRILIFDDHPASLRLVFGRRTSPRVRWPTPPSAQWWELPLAWMLLLGVLIMMFSPLLLKFPS